jgi:hypothetical protein
MPVGKMLWSCFAEGRDGRCGYQLAPHWKEKWSCQADGLKRERADAAVAWKDKWGCQANVWREIEPMQLEGNGMMWMGKGRAATAQELRMLGRDCNKGCCFGHWLCNSTKKWNVIQKINAGASYDNASLI